MDFPRLTAYLAGLAENNDKTWFDAHRAEYQALRDDFTAFVERVIASVAAWDDYAEGLTAKDCLFRINRDTRFSRDKSPYKTMFSAAIGKGHATHNPGYYFHVDHEGTLLLAGGLHNPEPEQLARVREHVAEHPQKVDAIVARPGFKEMFGEIHGEKLKRPPRGYSDDTPGIETIKLKSLYLFRQRSVAREKGDVLPWMDEGFRGMYPFNLWLREALTRPT